MSRKDFSQQFPSHRDFSQQFSSHHDFSQQFPNEHDFSQQFSSSNMIQNELVNTPPEDIFPVFTPENEPVPNPPVVQQQPDQPANNPPTRFGLIDEELLEQDLQVLREVEETEEREAAARRAREEARTERLNRETQYRWAMGLGPIRSESSASSDESYVSDDSFF
jgi:hypothetical protein